MSYQLWKGKQIMKDYERLKMMEYPKDRIDLVIDTDAATEIDDQFAIAYALLSRERFHIRGIYAAPFAMNEKTKDPNVGMQMSYDEIVNIMHLCGEIPMDWYSMVPVHMVHRSHQMHPCIWFSWRKTTARKNRFM